MKPLIGTFYKYRIYQDQRKQEFDQPSDSVWTQIRGDSKLHTCPILLLILESFMGEKIRFKQT